MPLKTQRDIRDEKSSFYPPHATNPSDTNSPPQINRGRLRHLSLPPYAVIHDMIATFIRPGWFTINLQSQGNRQTESKRGIDASCLLFLSFLFFQTHYYHHPSCFSLWEAAAWCLSKEVDFQSITCASNWLRTCAEMQVTFHIFWTFSTVNNSWKKVSSFSKSLPGVWKPF